MHWDSSKDEALWKILSGAAQTEIDCKLLKFSSFKLPGIPHADVVLHRESSVCLLCARVFSARASCTDMVSSAERFHVPVDFLLQQVAYLTERHASQVRAQVRKATAAAKGSSAPSPVPGSEPSSSAQQRAPSALSGRRESPMPGHDGTTSGTPLAIPIRPNISRDTSTNTTILKDAAGSASPRHGTSFPSRGQEQGGRKRLSSLPIASPKAKSPEPRQVDQRRDENASPGPAESSSNESSDDESSPAQSRIIRRPPRFQQQQEATETYQDDGDDESEPAFRPYQASDQSGQDMASTLRGDGRVSGRRSHKNSRRDFIHQSQTSDDSSTGSPTALQNPKSKESKLPGPLSPRRTAELAGRSPSGKAGAAASREGSDGTPSMGSSFSDLDGMHPMEYAQPKVFFLLTHQQTHRLPSRPLKKLLRAT